MKLKNKYIFARDTITAHMNRYYRVPLSVYFFITYKCPLSCRYCNIINNAQEKEELPTHKILSLIDEMFAAGTRKIHLTGGEPMAREDLGEIINYAKKKDIFVGVSTNGYYITEKTETLRNADIVFLSFDGEQEVHDYARGKGNYQKLMEAMAALRSKSIKFWTTTVLNKTNRGSVDFILAMAKKNNFIANFQILHSRNSDYRSCFISQDDADSFLMSLNEVKESAAYIIKKKEQGAAVGTSIEYLELLQNWSDYRIMYKNDPDIRCWAGRLYCYLEPDGMIYRCGSLQEQAAGQDAVKLGFKEAFNRIGDAPCQVCLSGCHTEQNLIFSLNIKTVRNWMRFI